MDPRFSNGFQLENTPTALELGPKPNQDLSPEQKNVHSSLENPVAFSKADVRMLRYIDQILMEEQDLDLEPHIDSSDFRAKERSFYETLIGQKYPPSPQQESSDDANNTTDEVIVEKTPHSESMNNNYVPIQEFDDSVWMYKADEELAVDMAKMEIMTRNNFMQPAGGHGGAEIRTKKRNNRGKDDQVVVDLRAILIDCSKLISSGDRIAANDLLRQIRQHSSPYGDNNQRLAHYFADGLEARLAGNIISRTHADTPDYLRAYRVSYPPSIMRKIFSFASNETIAIKSEKGTRIHVIDFGILYGVQWPSFIRRVAGREGGPPTKLRITGVDFPQVAEIIEDTGRRLARYAETLGVSFEYKAITREWEAIEIDDLKIDNDDFVAVVCSVRSMRLLDETFRVEESPRSMFLKLVREINPDIFLHMILNGAFNQPFFMYRFRDLLLHYLSIFDMVETLMPRDNPERVMIERDLIGKDILNVIACEGRERVERPETYRQWQVRNVKAGFMKVNFDRKLIDAITFKVSNLYMKDFVVSVQSQWMMISWKGRAFYAISCWQPAPA